MISSKIIQDNNSVDLSSHNTVFCDSLQALEWAYKNGLPQSAIIKASAPAVLWDKNPNIQNIEARWTIDEVEKFQSTIQELTKDLFDAVLSVDNVERELALTISRATYQFQRVLYKAACLEDDDFTSPRLFIYADGKTGQAGNMMNSIWDQLLLKNPLFHRIDYTLKNDNWKVLTTQGVSYWRRFKIGGYETIIYRLGTKIMKKIPDWVFTKEVLMPNENELNIEIASSLILNGVKVSKVQLRDLPNTVNLGLDDNITEIYKVVLPIVRKRVKQWVVPSAVEVTMLLFENFLKKKVGQFKQLTDEWGKVIKSSTVKQAVLINSPGNIKGYALSYVCRKKNIPLISSQHGVTIEISKAHNMLHICFDNSSADIMLSYNSKIIEIEKSTHFDKSKHYSVGMPMRLIRMKNIQAINSSLPPIVYISTNLYHMGFSSSLKTDYGKSRDEQELITDVLNRLPHKVRYKTYPEDNRRYADIDPVLNSVKKSDNIELFSEKIDMRYLVSEHSILVTTCATSTLSWPIMSEKPVVFIDQHNNNPLTDDARESMSKGIFVFCDNDKNFHSNLRDFLSQSIYEIEQLWQEKKVDRKKMISKYFSEYSSGAGKRSAEILLREYL